MKPKYLRVKPIRPEPETLAVSNINAPEEFAAANPKCEKTAPVSSAGTVILFISIPAIL